MDGDSMNSKFIGRIRIFIVVFILSGLIASVAAAAERVSVKAAIANIRADASTKSKVIWQVEKYHPFQVISKKKDWYEVKDYEGDKAWIHKSLLGKTKAVITVKSKCNVREKPTTKSKVVLRVERGVPFKVLKRKGNWNQIEHADGEVGWIHNSLVW